MFSLPLAGDKVKDTLKWSDDVSSAFAKGGLTLKNNEIIIPKSGLYFVYSQASFRVDCQVKDAELEGPVYLSHAVKRKSNLFGDERPLLQSIRSSCNRVVSEENGRGWYGTINLGAVFNLEEGDQLSTETSPVGDVLEDSDKTFFGAFAL